MLYLSRILVQLKTKLKIVKNVLVVIGCRDYGDFVHPSPGFIRTWYITLLIKRWRYIWYRSDLFLLRYMSRIERLQTKPNKGVAVITII